MTDPWEKASLNLQIGYQMSGGDALSDAAEIAIIEDGNRQIHPRFRPGGECCQANKAWAIIEERLQIRKSVSC